MLEQGIIEETNSPWAAPILVVPKPDGTGRLCVDYRRLNNLTEPDPFPMPRIDALLDRLGGVTIMTKLDMTRGYWQVPIHCIHYKHLYSASSSGATQRPMSDGLIGRGSNRFRDVTRSLSLAFYAFWPPKCSRNLQSPGHESVQGARRVL